VISRLRRLPTALTIAGSDSGGGAGIQADLKTFAGLGVHGTSAITCITAQNPRRVSAVQPIRPDIVSAQLQSIFEELPPAAIKTGMLYRADIITAVTDSLKHARAPIVVDPVMVSTSGAMLLKPSGLRALDALLPLATLVTPNLDEAQILAGRKLSSPEDLRAAARIIFERYGCAVLVKGGHLKQSREAIDILFDGKNEWLLAAPFVPGVSTHGTGCTYSAAITAYLARKYRLPEAVQRAKVFITKAIALCHTAGNHSVLNCLCDP
jgi:hydroxymethylpyrimidine kinase/phosphomethylpyrimidine kinase